MKKQQLEQFNDFKKDLLLWIKYFLQNKIELQKVQDGYSDDKKTAQKQKLKYFDRKLWQLKIMNTKTYNDLKEVARDIKNNGIKAHGTFSVPLLSLYEKLSRQKKLKSIRDIDNNVINAYISLNFQNYKEWTRRNYYLQIRSFFKFIDTYSISDDYFLFNMGLTPVGKRAKPPVNITPKKSEQYLEPDEFLKFIGSFKLYKKIIRRSNKAQPILLMKILSFTGIRASEARNITLKDVSTKTIDGDKYLQIYIKGKNDIDGYVFVLYDHIKEEYEQDKAFRKENKLKIKYLFYTRDYNQYAEKSLYDLVQRFLKHAKIHKPINTHGLRRSIASFYLARGVPLEKISILLRHSNEESVNFYAFASQKSWDSVKDITEVL